jgi:hypothetical protein
MTFIYPLGLLGLIAIPVLIIIYIIKSKYTEQVISATYLWTLSEKFLKKKRPISKLTGIISLILQIIAVICISFAIAQPVITLKGVADDYYFIIDGSGSMNITQGDNTRFDLGKNEISSMISSSANGSRYSIVYVADTTQILVENSESKEQALRVLSDLTASHQEVNFSQALDVAQKHFEEYPYAKTYLVTDKQYENCQNVNLINVAANEVNYSVADLSVKISNNKLYISGNAYSYESDASVTVGLFIDGAEEPEQKKTLDVTKDTACAFEFERASTSYTSIKVAILSDDALTLDNSCVLYNNSYDSAFKTLIVSDNGTIYLRAALAALGNAQAEVVTTTEYKNNTDYSSGYGLYIFDGYSPDSVPETGAVWFVNPTGSTTNSGFSVNDTVEITDSSLQIDDDCFNSSSSTKVKSLLNGLVSDSFALHKYVKCSRYLNFIELVYAEDNPIIFAGTNNKGNREVVFAFDFRDTDLVLKANFPILVGNLLSYTFPEIMDTTATYYCGSAMTINVPSNCKNITVTTQSGSKVDLDVEQDTVDYVATEAGLNTITISYYGNSDTVLYVYTQLPLNERQTTVSATTFSIEGQPSDEKLDGKYDDLLYLFIILAVVVIADWMVYCYEQYQLR